MGNRFIPGQEQQTWAERFRPEMTPEHLIKNYEHYQKLLRDEAKRIQHSSETRKLLIKNIKNGDPLELLEKACECIYELTGDSVFENSIKRAIEERKNQKGVQT